MNEWKDANKEELLNRIDDVINYLNCGVTHERQTIIDVLTRQKPEPKQPTHEEIMTKWWLTSEGVWQKVHTYNSYGDVEREPIYIFNCSVDGGRQIEKFERYVTTIEWFIDKESADIPPETE